MRFSVESLARPISLTAVAVAVVGTGVAAERVVPPPYRAGDWVPDLLVGLVVAGAGLLATALRRTSWTGPLLLLAGVAWFVPNFAHTGPGWLAAIAAACVFLHRGLLTHAALAYPTGRPSSLRSLLVIATIYAASVWAAAWQHAIVAIVLVSAVVVTTTFDYRAAAGTGRRARLPAVAAAGLFALVVVVESLIRGAVTTRALLTGYQLAVVAVAGVLSAGLLVATAGRDEVTDLVVELGRGRSGSLRDRLAIVLGDPSLQVGYWIPDEERYVDSAGRALDVRERSDRAVTRIDRGDMPVAVLVHDEALLEDEGLVAAVATATRLAAANARLHAEMRAQVAEASESRRRIVDAAVDERRRLEHRLTDRVLGRLDQLGESLVEVRRRSAAIDTETLERAVAQLAAAREELAQLAQGIHPGRLSAEGLTAMLRTLAATVPVQVTVDVGTRDLPDAISACAWFVCAEALTNVAKYATATWLEVSVTRSAGLLVIRIADDGVGGADAARGSGLRGLADRVTALGGTFTVDSPVDSGTVVLASLPAAGGASPERDRPPGSVRHRW